MLSCVSVVFWGAGFMPALFCVLQKSRNMRDIQGMFVFYKHPFVFSIHPPAAENYNPE